MPVWCSQWQQNLWMLTILQTKKRTTDVLLSKIVDSILPALDFQNSRQVSFLPGCNTDSPSCTIPFIVSTEPGPKPTVLFVKETKITSCSGRNILVWEKQTTNRTLIGQCHPPTSQAILPNIVFLVVFVFVFVFLFVFVFVFVFVWKQQIYHLPGRQ